MKSSISYTSSNPFGMPMPGRQYISALASKRFGYQGQFAEKDEETGYNNFYFRDYDAEVGRFLTFDPMNEFHSPYVGMGNNPISFTDPTGGCVHCGVVSSGGKSAVAKFIADFGVDMAIGIGTGTAQGGVDALNGGQAGPGGSSKKIGTNKDGLSVYQGPEIEVSASNNGVGYNAGGTSGVEKAAVALVLLPEGVSTATGLIILGGLAAGSIASTVDWSKMHASTETPWTGDKGSPEGPNGRPNYTGPSTIIGALLLGELFFEGYIEYMELLDNHKPKLKPDRFDIEKYKTVPIDNTNIPIKQTYLQQSR